MNGTNIPPAFAANFGLDPAALAVKPIRLYRIKGIVDRPGVMPGNEYRQNCNGSFQKKFHFSSHGQKCETNNWESRKSENIVVFGTN